MEVYSLIINKVCPFLNDWSNTILFKDNSNSAASISVELIIPAHKEVDFERSKARSASQNSRLAHPMDHPSFKKKGMSMNIGLINSVSDFSLFLNYLKTEIYLFLFYLLKVRLPYLLNTLSIKKILRFKIIFFLKNYQ